MRKILGYTGKICIIMLFCVLCMLIGKKTKAYMVGTSEDKFKIAFNDQVMEGQNLLLVSPNTNFPSNKSSNIVNRLYREDIENYFYQNGLEIKTIETSRGYVKNGRAILGTGAIITTTDDRVMTLVLYGDGNGDGMTCDVSDMNMIVQNIMRWKKVSGLSKFALDVYNDKELTVFDTNRMALKIINRKYPSGDTLVRKMPEDTLVVEHEIFASVDKEEMYVGEQMDISVAVKPPVSKQDVNFESSTPAVATVDDEGTITAVSEGTATITVSSDYYDATSEVTITVVPRPISVTDLRDLTITYDYDDGFLVGDYAYATATVKPDNASNKTIIWTSSNPNVATIDETGRIRAVSKGKTIITATTEDQGISLSQEIEVIDEIKVRDIRITLENAVEIDGTLVLNDKVRKGTKLITSTEVLPARATNDRIKWTSSNQWIATVNENGVITAEADQEGTVIITAEAKDGSGVKKRIRITVIK